MPIKIDLEKLQDIAHVGVRRATIFMGLGLNAAHKDDFNDYELNKLPIVPGQTNLPIELFPRELPVERVREFKREFAIWVTICGMRELLEYFALFLDQMHRYALVVFHARGELQRRRINPFRAQREFNGKFGIARKLDVLAGRFGINPADTDHIKRLYEARNCLTHDLGTVHARRCRTDGHFLITWKALEFVAKGRTSGTERSILDLVGTVTNEDMGVSTRVVTREKKLRQGDKLNLSQQDLWEILLFLQRPRHSRDDQGVRGVSRGRGRGAGAGETGARGEPGGGGPAGRVIRQPGRAVPANSSRTPCRPAAARSVHLDAGGLADRRSTSCAARRCRRRTPPANSASPRCRDW